MDEKSELIVGCLAGILVGLVLTAFLLKFTKTDRRVREYDERQAAARGKGFKYGFFAFMTCDVVYGVVSVKFSRLPLDAVAAMGLIVIMSVMVHVSYCIWHDAYFALNENRPRLIVVFAAAGLLNLLLAVWSIRDGRMTEDGVLNLHSLNLFCAVMFIVIFAELLAKHRISASQEGEGEA